MTCFTAHWVTSAATKGPAPETLSKQLWAPTFAPQPYPASDPSLGAIWRNTPSRQPRDLIKSNYHQPLVLTGRKAVSANENQYLFLHIFLQEEQSRRH